MRVTMGVAGVLACAAALSCGGGEPAGQARGGEATASRRAEKERAGEERAAGELAEVRCDTLLPPAEVRALLGVEPEPVGEQVFPGSSSCIWHFTPKDSVNRDFFQVVVSFGPAAMELFLPTRDAEARWDTQEPQAVSGIGDEAYTWVGARLFRRLHVRQGGRTLVIRGPVALPALADEAGMRRLASTLLGRF